MLALGYFPQPGGSSSEPGKEEEEEEEGRQPRRNRFQVGVVPLKNNSLLYVLREFGTSTRKYTALYYRAV